LRLQQLDEIAELTAQMLVLAQQGSWERLTELQHNRDIKLRSCFAAPLTPEDTSVAVEKIRNLLQENERVVEVISKVRDELGTALQGVHRKHKIADTYLEAGLER
jgi:hypothetical protein